MDDIERYKEELVEQLRGKWIEDQPYVFISYASRDWEKVYPTVIELRNRGFNVYIDTELQEVATRNWLDNIRERLFDCDIQGIISFLSPNYMRSYACMIELLLNQSEDMKDDRGDSLPVIYVSLDSNMGCLQDINQYIRTDAIRKESKSLDAKMQPEERSVLEETLCNCRLKEAMSRDMISKDIDKISTRHDVACRMEKYVLSNATIAIQPFKSTTSCVDMLENNFTNSKNKDIELQRMPELIGQSVAGTEEKHKEKPVEKPVERQIEKPVEKPAPPVFVQVKDENQDNETQDDETQVFYFQGATAECVQDKYIVKKDSIISGEEADSCPDAAKRARREALEAGELVKENGDYRLLVDKMFKSSSGAATFVAGSSVSGPASWKKTAGSKKSADEGKARKSKASNDWLTPGMEVYVKNHEDSVGIITEEGTVSYSGRTVSLNQYVQVVLGPGSRNAYLYVCEKKSGKTLAQVRAEKENESLEQAKDTGLENKKELDMKPVETDCIGSDITIGDVRSLFSDALTAVDFRPVRENMPRGGKGALDYAMAAILGGCNNVTTNSPQYQINYYIYDVATTEEEKKKQDGGLGATWTWSSNCRKVLDLDGAGQIPKELDEYFKLLPETATLGDIERWFKEGTNTAFKTKKNDMVVMAVQKVIEFFKSK